MKQLVANRKYGSQSETGKRRIFFDVYIDPSVKVEAAKWFKRMEGGDESALDN